MIDSLSIRARLLIAFGVLVAVILAISAVTYVREAQIEESLATTSSRSFVVTRSLANARVEIERIRQENFYHAMSKDPKELAGIEAATSATEARLDEDLAAAEATFDANDERHASIAALREAIRTYRQERERDLYPISRTLDVEAGLKVIMTTLKATYDRITDTIERLKMSNERVIDDANARMRANIEAGRRTSLTISAIGIILAGGLAFLITRDILQRLGHLAEVAAAVREGDTKQRAKLRGTDELALLGTAFDTMLDELAKTAAETAKLANEQKFGRDRLEKAVAIYGGFVERVAAGDSTTTNVPIGSEELASLGENLGRMSGGLRGMAIRVQEAVALLGSAAANIMTTAAELSSSATETASAVTETVATVEEVARTAEQSTERARTAVEASETSLAVSQAGRNAVEEALSTMDRVRDQMAAIGERMLALSEQAQAAGGSPARSRSSPSSRTCSR